MIPQAISNFSIPDVIIITTQYQLQIPIRDMVLVLIFLSNWTLQTNNEDGATAMVYTGNSDNEIPLFQLTITPNRDAESDEDALNQLNTAPDFPWDEV